MANRDAKTRQAMRHESEGAAVQGQIGQHFVTRLQHRPQRGRDGPHARAKHHRASALLQAAQAGLQQRQRRVGNAGIEIARLLTGETTRAIGHIGKSEGGRGVNRRHQRTLVIGRVVAMVNGAGAEALGGREVAHGESLLRCVGG